MRQTALNMVHELARLDQRVVFIGSDLGAGTLQNFREEFPDRWFMEGVAEQNLIGLASGLALEGFIPYVNTIATFLSRRCFEQIVVDACLHNLPLRLLSSGGGLVYAPLGPTHLAIEDLSILRAVPNMTVIAPSDAHEMRLTMESSLAHAGPLYIRFGKGGDPVVPIERNGFEIGRAYWVLPPEATNFVSTGIMTEACRQVALRLAAEGRPCGVLHVPTVKPLDIDALWTLARSSQTILTVEENVLAGGLGSAVLEALVDNAMPLTRFKRLGLPDAFSHNYGSQADLLRDAGLTSDQIHETALREISQC
ncbi:MAG: transketolase [Alphaproteobacteria bacterium]|nr:transketolase [Alphaproteobacteria bacterium]